MILGNPGYIRTGKEQMRLGGVSNPRNQAMMKMFNLVQIGGRSGSGIPDVFNAWADAGLEEPIIEEQFKPDRTILTLSFKKKVTEKIQNQTKMIISKMKPNVEYKVEEVAEWLDVGRTRARSLLKMLVEKGGYFRSRCNKKEEISTKVT